jgi:hypothetical protein
VRRARSDGYGRFSRFYDTPEGSFPSVTTILNAVAKPALVPWAAKMERELVLRTAVELNDDLPMGLRLPRMAYSLELEKRLPKTKAHQKELDKAADIGSQIHGRIEWELRRELRQEVGREPQLSEKALWGFMAWEDWRKQANLVPLAIEQTIWHGRNGYAGTLDLMAELDTPWGKRGIAIIDWKSGKGIYPEALLQNAAYVSAARYLNHADEQTHGLIVRVPKMETDPDFEVRWIRSGEQPALLDTFLAVFRLWRWLDEQNDQKEAKAS